MKYSVDRRHRNIPACLQLYFTCMASQSDLLLCGQHKSVYAGLCATPACNELTVQTFPHARQDCKSDDKSGEYLRRKNRFEQEPIKSGCTWVDERAGEQSSITSTGDTGKVVSRDCKRRTHIGHWCFVTLNVVEVRYLIHSAGKTQ